MKKETTTMGFEPTRAMHIDLAGQRLNHSATLSISEGPDGNWTRDLYSPKVESYH